jgi:hypothetical protein
MKNTMKNTMLLSLSFLVLVGIVQYVQASTYTMTNLSARRAKVTYKESFKDSESKILEPNEVFKKDTSALNCLDYAQVEAVDKNGTVLSPFPYKQAPVCAGATTLCIVNGYGPNPVEIYQAWSGTSAADCARGR